MQWIHVNKDELFFLLYGLKIVASGGNGRIFQYNDRTLAKIYLSFLGESYKEFDVEEMISKISMWCSEDRLMKVIYPDYETTSERIFRIAKRLKNTSCSDLIQGAIFYQDFAMASLLLDYTKEGYVVYKKICKEYGREENSEILNKTQEKVMELMNECIYPRDIKFGNVMVRPKDLDVRLIDLDDGYTKYADCKDYVCCAEVLNQLERMKVRILKK